MPSVSKSKTPKSRSLTKDGCKYCEAITKSGERCKNKAACDLKCTKYCRVHSPGYDDGNEVCTRPAIRREAKKPGRKPSKTTKKSSPKKTSAAKKTSAKKTATKKATAKKSTAKRVVSKKAKSTK